MGWSDYANWSSPETLRFSPTKKIYEALVLAINERLRVFGWDEVKIGELFALSDKYWPEHIFTQIGLISSQYIDVAESLGKSAIVTWVSARLEGECDPEGLVNDYIYPEGRNAIFSLHDARICHLLYKMINQLTVLLGRNHAERGVAKHLNGQSKGSLQTIFNSFRSLFANMNWQIGSYNAHMGCTANLDYYDGGVAFIGYDYYFEMGGMGPRSLEHSLPYGCNAIVLGIGNDRNNNCHMPYCKIGEVTKVREQQMECHEEKVLHPLTDAMAREAILNMYNYFQADCSYFAGFDFGVEDGFEFYDPVQP